MFIFQSIPGPSSGGRSSRPRPTKEEELQAQLQALDEKEEAVLEAINKERSEIKKKLKRLESKKVKGILWIPPNGK